MKIFFRLVLVIAVLTMAGAARPQQVVQAPEGRIAVRVEMVNLLCSVLDRRGNYVTTLAQDDFIIYENNAPQKIENFSAMSDLPLSIALLIDTSASVANKLKFEQDAAAEFFLTVLRPQDKALLVEFDTGVTLIQDFTNDTNLLGKQLKTLRAAGGTSLYDAILLVAEEKLVPDQGERRKTVIVISDGEDTVSKVTFEEALEMAQRSGATIFAISTNKGGHFGVKGSDEGDAILEQLTSATGGKAYYPTKMDDLRLAFREIGRAHV